MDADGGYPVAEEVQLATQGDKGAAGRLHPVMSCPLIWCAEDSQYGFLDDEKNNTMWNTRSLSDFESEEGKC